MGKRQEKLNLAESLCTQCGLCCYKKGMTPNGQVVFLREKCEYLGDDNLCAVYEDRLEMHGCCSIERAIMLNALPMCCPYIKENWKLIKHYYKAPNLILIKRLQKDIDKK